MKVGEGQHTVIIYVCLDCVCFDHCSPLQHRAVDDSQSGLLVIRCSQLPAQEDVLDLRGGKSQRVSLQVCSQVQVCVPVPVVSVCVEMSAVISVWVSVCVCVLGPVSIRTGENRPLRQAQHRQPLQVLHGEVSLRGGRRCPSGSSAVDQGEVPHL